MGQRHPGPQHQGRVRPIRCRYSIKPVQRPDDRCGSWCRASASAECRHWSGRAVLALLFLATSVHPWLANTWRVNAGPCASRRIGAMQYACAITTPLIHPNMEYACELGRVPMTFAIHASKNGRSVVTVRIRPDATVDKARLLERFGWKVHITDLAGHRFGVSEFDRFLWINRGTAFPEIAVQERQQS